MAKEPVALPLQMLSDFKLPSPKLLLKEPIQEFEFLT